MVRGDQGDRARGRAWRGRQGRRGQASAELVATLPVLALVTLVVAQLVAAGWSLWSAGVAARAGARAEYVGGDGEGRALDALPEPLRAGASAHADADTGAVRVRVISPSLLARPSKVEVGASAGVGPRGPADG